VQDFDVASSGCEAALQATNAMGKRPRKGSKDSNDSDVSGTTRFSGATRCSAAATAVTGKGRAKGRAAAQAAAAEEDFCPCCKESSKKHQIALLSKICVVDEHVRSEYYPFWTQDEFISHNNSNAKVRKVVARLRKKFLDAQVEESVAAEGAAAASSSGMAVEPTPNSATVAVETEYFADTETLVEGYTLTRFRKCHNNANPWDVPKPVGPIRPVLRKDFAGKVRSIYKMTPANGPSVLIRYVKRQKSRSRSSSAALRPRRTRRRRRSCSRMRWMPSRPRRAPARLAS
jgi:hypothetical protein